MRIDLPQFIDVHGTKAARRVLLSKATIFASTAAVDFSLPDAFQSFEVWAKNVRVDTDDTELWVRLSEDYAATFKSGASDYEWAKLLNTSVEGQQAGPSDTADPQINLSHSTANLAIGSASGEGANARIMVFNAHSTVMSPIITWQHWYQSASAGNPTISRGAGQFVAATRVSGIRLFPESGNFTEGYFALYGVAK